MTEHAKPSGPTVRTVPPGDDRPRLVCPDCGFIAYENPKIVVGSVVSHEGRILLCRRAIDPRLGFWTLPAGYMEFGETAEDGAKREAWEEARARIDIDGLLAVFSLPHAHQVQLIYRATLAAEEIAPGPESLEVALYDWDDIPWADLAFPSVHWSLQRHAEMAGRPLAQPGGVPPDATPGL